MHLSGGSSQSQPHLMGGHQARGAGGIGGDAGPLQAKCVRYATNQVRDAIACCV